MAGMNKMRALNRLPYDFEDGLLINGVDVTGPTGAATVGYTPAGTGAVATTVQSKLRGAVISVFDYMTDAQRVDAMSATPTVDCTSAVQAAVAHAMTLQGRVTIDGYGICVINGTVNFSHGEIRKPIYFTGGGYKKTNSGSMFSATVDNTGEIFFDNVYFESVVGAGTIIFNTDYIIRLHTTGCVFREVDTAWYSGDDFTDGFAYSQSIRSIGDTITGGAGYAVNIGRAFDCTFQNITIESRQSGIRVNKGCSVLRIIDPVIEGLQGVAISIGGSTTSPVAGLIISGGYFELNTQGNIIFDATAEIKTATIISNNIPDVGTAPSAIVWPNITRSAISIGNRCAYGQLHSRTGYENGVGQPVNILNDQQELLDWPTAGFYRNNHFAIVSSVRQLFSGGFRRYSRGANPVLPANTVNTLTMDMGVTLNTEDLITIKINTTSDVRLLRYYNSGTSVAYVLQNNTALEVTPIVHVTVLKGYSSND